MVQEEGGTSVTQGGLVSDWGAIWTNEGVRPLRRRPRDKCLVGSFGDARGSGALLLHVTRWGSY